MPGILANSARVTMTSPAALSSGYVTGERITLSLDVAGASYQWGVSTPGGSKLRGLTNETTATPTIAPDAEGAYVVTCLVGGSTVYTIRLVVTASPPVFFRGGVNSQVLTDPEVPVPVVGATMYFNAATGRWSWKDAAGVTHELAETGTALAFVRPEWFGAKGDGVADDTAPLKRAIEAAIGVASGALDDASAGDNESRVADRVPVLLRGRYRTTAPIFLRHYGVSLVGEHVSSWGVPSNRSKGTIVADHNVSGGHAFVITATAGLSQPWNITFQDIAITKGATNVASGAAIAWDGPGFLAYYRLEGLRIDGFQNGIEILSTYAGTEVAYVTLERCSIFSNYNVACKSTSARFNLARFSALSMTANTSGGVDAPFLISTIDTIEVQNQPNAMRVRGSQTLSLDVGTVYCEGNSGDALLNLEGAVKTRVRNLAPSTDITTLCDVRAVSCVDVSYPGAVAATDLFDSDIRALKLIASGSDAAWKYGNVAAWRIGRPLPQRVPDSLGTRTFGTDASCVTATTFGGKSVSAKLVGTVGDKEHLCQVPIPLAWAPGEHLLIGFACRFQNGFVAANANLSIRGVLTGSPTTVWTGQTYIANQFGADTVLVWLTARNRTATSFTSAELYWEPYGWNGAAHEWYGALVSQLACWVVPNGFNELPLFDPLVVL